MINEGFKSQVQILKLLSHPARLAILELLRNGEECVCHMEAFLGYKQAYLSQQLAVLREAEIIQDRRDGWNIFYKVIQPDIYKVVEAINEFVGEDIANTLAVDICECPKCMVERK